MPREIVPGRSLTAKERPGRRQAARQAAALASQVRDPQTRAALAFLAQACLAGTGR
jgi:hypothetical protein